MQFIKGLAIRLALAMFVFANLSSLVAAAPAPTVVVVGNQRVDTETIRSYFTSTSPGDVNQAVKQLYATGLFSKVDAHPEGNRIVVTVAENGLVNRVAFEGNTKVKSEQLAAELESKTRGAYNPATVRADVERILDIYRHNGFAAATVTSRIVPLPNGRVDVVFTINENGKTGVRSIEFVGNHAFSSGRLRDLMTTTEMNFLSWLKTTDVYDPDRLSKDEDLIRRFYLKNGYADFRIVGQDVTYDPAVKGYHIVITVEEGRQYHVSSVDVDTHLPDIDPKSLRYLVPISAGDVYNGDAVQKAVENLTKAVIRRGYAFASATPHADRNPATRTITLDFTVEEGPRVYIERINILGNTRTRDYVIRREFDIGEGDPYNKALIDLAERRLNGLGYFKSVKITNEPGSAPDRVIIDVNVEDQPTGSFSISGGYSTTDGLIAEASISESNFLGRGEFARFAVSYGQYSKGVEFNFTEPYLFGYRMAGGFDLYHKETDNSKYALYDDYVTGGTLRLGLPITDEITFSPHYSAYQSKISIPDDSVRPYNDCSTVVPGTTPGTANAVYGLVTWTTSCLSNGEASVALKAAAGSTITSLVGYSISYNSLDNPRDPTEGIYAAATQDLAGLGGDSKFLRSTFDLHFYHPIIFDRLIGIIHLQGGDILGYGSKPLAITDNFNLGPSLVRGFAPGGIGPRDVTDPFNANANSLGGTKYLGASAEVQFPILGLPKEIGLRGAFFADAGTLFGYEGQQSFPGIIPDGGTNSYFASVVQPTYPTCPAPSVGVCYVDANNNATSSPSTGGVPNTPIDQASKINLQDSNKIRASVGASILWASPLGPIRFNYSFILSKATGDVTQRFSFSGGSSF